MERAGLEPATPSLQILLRGGREWSAAVGDTLALVWSGDLSIDEALDELVPLADDVLAANQ